MGVQFSNVFASAYVAGEMAITLPISIVGLNRYLAVDIAFLAGGGVGSCTYNGVELTFIGGEAGSVINQQQCWGMLNPPTGQHDVVVTCPDPSTFVVFATGYTGVDQLSAVTDYNSLIGTGFEGFDETSYLELPTTLPKDWMHGVLVGDEGITAVPEIATRARVVGALGTAVIVDDGPGTRNAPFLLYVRGRVVEDERYCLGGYLLHGDGKPLLKRGRPGGWPNDPRFAFPQP